MSITDELREFVDGADGYELWCPRHKKELLAIADRIDAEHKKACDDAWDNGYEADYLGIEKWLTEHPQVMEHHGWVRKNKEHVIAHAAVEVTPHIDWARMADELDEFVEIVRGMALAEEDA